MDQDCGCEIEKDGQTVKVDVVIDSNGVGEEIFRDEDLFDRVKKFYSSLDDEELEEENDLLLDNLNRSASTELEFFHSLTRLQQNISEKVNRKIEVSKESPIELLENKSTVLMSESRSYKINIIKDYLKRLTDGS